MINIIVEQGDITKKAVDVIVNAANRRLLGGGGVDGAIHRAGGPDIMNECDQIRTKQGGCATGQAVITTAGMLPAKHVIHTVGPIWNGGADDEVGLLKSCYQNSLKLAEHYRLKTISFPNISTGVYGFPKDQAAEVAAETVKGFFEITSSNINQVIFVCFGDENYQLYRTLI